MHAVEYKPAAIRACVATKNARSICRIEIEEKKPLMSRMKARTNKCVRGFRIRGLFVESELKKKGHE